VSEASVFCSEGRGNANYSSQEGDHPIEACECHAVSSHDLLDLDQKCDCRIFEDRNKKDIADPESDVEERITKQIQGTIADILSEIIQNALH